MPNVFQAVDNLHPIRNAFDISDSKIFTCDMGELIPVHCRRMIPGDTFRMGAQTVVRLQPMATPILHDITVTCHTFFVPDRLLYPKFDKYISGGKKGDFFQPYPKWNPTNEDLKLFSLWDYMGFPIVNYTPPAPDSRNLPHDAPRRAYNFIWDEFYRDSNLDAPINTGDDGEEETPPTVWGDNRKILRRRYKKDYLTSALIQRQRGKAPSLPISGEAKAVFNGDIGTNTSATLGSGTGNLFYKTPSGEIQLGVFNPDGITATQIREWFNNNTVDLSVASTFDIADLRTVIALQQWMERNNRCGYRYKEFIKAHFGVNLPDSRLQRPEYIGGTKSEIIVSEVLQTEPETTSPAGSMAGHGLGATEGYIGDYYAQEFGVIMTLMSVMPKVVYEDGISREWLWNDKEDWPFPEFANLSEQGIYNMEVFPTGNEIDDMDIWAFQGRNDELRVGRDIVCSEMRVKVPSGETSLADWHLARSFTSRPNLNSEFIECNPDKRVFIAQSAKTLIVHHATIIKSIRPLPEIAVPGLKSI